MKGTHNLDDLPDLTLIPVHSDVEILNAIPHSLLSTVEESPEPVKSKDKHWQALKTLVRDPGAMNLSSAEMASA